MNKLFEYEIKGIKLDVEDMIRIHNYYEAACTAEYVMYNYGINSDEEALKIGYNVRGLMDKYGYTENEALDEFMADYGGTI